MAEIARLVWRLVWVWRPPAGFVLAWSRWRQEHQAQAQRDHYRRRGAVPNDRQLEY